MFGRDPRWSIAGVAPVDVAVGLGLVAIGLADAVTTDEYDGGTGRLVVAVVLQTAPVVWRRTHTLPAVALSTLGLTIEVAGQDPYGGLYGLLGFVLLAHAGARWASRSHQPYCAGGLLAGVAIHALSESAQGPLGWVGGVLVPLAVGAAAWAVGILGRHGQERERALVAGAAAAQAEWVLRERAIIEEERARISRELHDVVGHALAGISLTAGAAEQQAGSRDPEVATALDMIRTLSRDAASDVRRLVGLLRDDSDPSGDTRPQPTLGDVPGLVERARTAGMEVELVQRGRAVPVPGGVHLAAVRLIQEGLTNAARHAPGSVVEIVVDWQHGRLEVSVENTASGHAPRSERADPGHGLVGLRERIAIHEGRLVAEATPVGGFRLAAGLPLP